MRNSTWQLLKGFVAGENNLSSLMLQFHTEHLYLQTHNSHFIRKCSVDCINLFPCVFVCFVFTY